MKRTILAATLTLLLVSTVAIAQSMHSPAEENQNRQIGHNMMEGNSHGHGKRMGMHGKGMGMMGQSGHCTMGQGMHGAGMMGSGSVAQRDAFLDSTKELRKSIHDKQFEYMEASRNSAETVGSLRKKAEELSVLKQDLMKKRQKAFSKK